MQPGDNVIKKLKFSGFRKNWRDVQIRNREYENDNTVAKTVANDNNWIKIGIGSILGTGIAKIKILASYLHSQTTLTCSFVDVIKEFLASWLHSKMMNVDTIN